MAPRRTAGAFGRVSCGQHLDESSSVSKNLSSVFLSGRDFLSRRGFHGPEGARLGPDRVADAPLAAETQVASLAYYLVGLLALRSPEASTWQIFAAATMFALPLVVLLLPRTRMLFATAKSNAAGYHASADERHR
jgi:hypothetical protein